MVFVAIARPCRLEVQLGTLFLGGKYPCIDFLRSKRLRRAIGRDGHRKPLSIIFYSIPPASYIHQKRHTKAKKIVYQQLISSRVQYIAFYFVSFTILSACDGEITGSLL